MNKIYSFILITVFSASVFGQTVPSYVPIEFTASNTSTIITTNSASQSIFNSENYDACIAKFNALNVNQKSGGFHIGLGTGSSIFRGEVGYSFPKKFRVGVLIERGFIFEIPSYNAAYFRMNLKDNDLDIGAINGVFHGYIGASVGQIMLKGSTTEEIDIFTGKVTKTVIPDEKISGYSGTFGIEISYSKKAKTIMQFVELNIGRVPTGFFQYLMASSNITPTSVKISNTYSWAVGLRFYL